MKNPTDVRRNITMIMARRVGVNYDNIFFSLKERLLPARERVRKSERAYLIVFSFLSKTRDIS